jgi:periplasmic protein TonB
MFDVLLESRARPPRRPRTTLASMLVHGALVAAAIGLTRPGSGRAITPPTPPKPPIYLPMHPETRVDHRTDHRSGPVGAQMGRSIPVPIFNPTELPPIDLAIAVPVAEPDTPKASGDFTRRGFPIDGGWLQYQGDVVDEHNVDRTPRVIGRAPEPRYPAPLRDSGIQGRVVAEFVVDTLGRAEMDGLKVDAPQALFGEAVRAVLPRYHFTPGEAAGHKVRTRVQLPFDFALRR